MKKGQIVLTTGVLITVVVIFLFLLFGIGVLINFVTNNILALLGGFIIVFGLIIASRQKKNNARTIALTVIFGLILISLSSLGIFQQSFFGNKLVYQAEFGNIECKESDTFDTLERYMDNLPIFISGGFFSSDKYGWECDDFANECEFDLRADRSISGFSVAPNGNYFICDSDGNNCGSKTQFQSTSQSDVVPKTNRIIVPVGKALFLEKGSLGGGFDKGLVRKYVKPFQLIQDERGQLTELTQTGCTLPSNKKDEVLNQDYQISGDTYVGGNRCLNIPKGDFCNYFLGFSPLVDTTYQYQGQEVMCQSQSLYSLKDVQFLDGSTKTFQDQFIKNVECCPDEPFCDENFERVDEPVQNECNSDVQCLNAGNPLPTSDTTYVQYECVNNQCQESNEKTTECTTTARCVETKGINYVCDLNPSNYGVCVLKASAGEYCGDGTCNENLNENEFTCSADCGFPDQTQLLSEEECNQKAEDNIFLGYEYVETTEEKGIGPFGIGGIVGLTEEVKTEQCVATFLPYYVVALAIIIGGATVIILFRKERR